MLNKLFVFKPSRISQGFGVHVTVMGRGNVLPRGQSTHARGTKRDVKGEVEQESEEDMEQQETPQPVLGPCVVLQLRPLNLNRERVGRGKGDPRKIEMTPAAGGGDTEGVKTAQLSGKVSKVTAISAR